VWERVPTIASFLESLFLLSKYLLLHPPLLTLLDNSSHSQLPLTWGYQICVPVSCVPLFLRLFFRCLVMKIDFPFLLSDPASGNPDDGGSRQVAGQKIIPTTIRRTPLIKHKERLAPDRLPAIYDHRPHVAGRFLRDAWSPFF